MWSILRPDLQSYTYAEMYSQDRSDCIPTLIDTTTAKTKTKKTLDVWDVMSKKILLIVS